MRIGIDIRTLMDKRFSGVPEYTFNIVRSILEIDRLNRYRLFYNSPRDLSAQMPVFDFPNVEMVKLNYPNKVLNYGLFKLLDRPKIDKVLNVDAFFMPHLNFVSLSEEVRSLLTIHDLSFLRYPEFFSWRKNFWHSMINVRKLARRFDRIIAVSENTKRDVIDLLQIDPDKIEVIYSAISEEFASGGSDSGNLRSIKIKYALPDNFILFLGTIEPRKNIIGLMQAYERLLRCHPEMGPVKLVIAGGQGWRSREIYEYWKMSGERDNIIFLGYVDSADKPAIYNMAKVFVYPSYYEGFGFPPLEAMACGTPVICSFNSSLSEIAGDAALMIDPSDIEMLARSMYLVLSDNILSHKLAIKGRAQASDHNWKTSARRILKILSPS